MEVQTLLPCDYKFPDGGVHARLSKDTLGMQARKQEALMQDHKINAAIAYARENKLNRVTVDSAKARLGIVASGKSHRDVLEALEELGIGPDEAESIGIRVFKVSMPRPLEPESIRNFSDGLEEILVVEEKRQIGEYQLKEHLYNWREDVRPRVIGKFDEAGEWAYPRGDWLLPAKSDLSVAQIARVIAARVARFHTSDRIHARLAILDAKDAVLGKAVNTPARPAWYCSGCPHNTSTKVPEAQPGAGRHRLPRDGHRDLSRAQQDDHAHGRRRRALARPGLASSIDFDTAVEFARLPQQIRGFGHVKQAAIDAASVRREALAAKLEPMSPTPAGSALANAA